MPYFKGSIRHENEIVQTRKISVFSKFMETQKKGLKTTILYFLSPRVINEYENKIYILFVT